MVRTSPLVAAKVAHPKLIAMPAIHSDIVCFISHSSFPAICHMAQPE